MPTLELQRRKSMLLRKLTAEILELMPVVECFPGSEALEFVKVLELLVCEVLDQCALADAPPPTADDQSGFRQAGRASQLCELGITPYKCMSICSNGAHSIYSTANRHT